VASGQWVSGQWYGLDFGKLYSLGGRHPEHSRSSGGAKDLARIATAFTPLATEH
jgi:hypothetical protein